jgi:PAS domain S-box-containing protein
MIVISQNKPPFGQDDKQSLLWDGYTKSIIENVNVWINVYDQELNLILWNPMAEKISGYNREEVLGHTHVWDLLYPETAYRDMIVTRAADLLIGKATVDDYETQILCKNGDLKNIVWNSKPLYDESSHFQGAITFGYDITDRKKSEINLQKAHEDLSVLYNVVSIASESIDLGEILERSLALVLPVIKAPKGIIHIWHDDLQEFHLAAHQGFSNESISALSSLTAGDGIIDRIFKKESPIYIPSLITELENTPNNVPIRLFHAFLGVPMRAKGKVCGVFSVFGKADQPFTKYVISLLTSISDQIGVAVENARLYQQSRQLAVSEERRRLARELHDAVTQSLYSLTLFAEAGQRDLRDGKLEEVSKDLTELGQTAYSALNEMRVLLHELRPLALESEGLLDAIQRRMDAVERRAGIKAYLIAEPGLNLPSLVEQELYRIIQEALNNTLRHASAQTVSVSIQTSDNELTVKITDDGVGFDCETVTQRGGLGLEGMHERAGCLGGELRIISAIGEGVTITLKIRLDNWKKELRGSVING